MQRINTAEQLNTRATEAERRLADVEAQLRESEARYRSVFHSIDAGLCVIEMLFDERNQPVDYRFLEINAVFEEQTGLKQALGKTARELVPNLEAHWFELYGNVALSGVATRFTQGSEAMGRQFDVYAFRVGGGESRKVGILFNDVTARERAEAALRQSEASFRAVQETSIDGFMVLESVRDAAGQIVDFRWAYANAAAERIVGKPRAWFLGRRLLEAMPGNREEGLYDAYVRVVETGEPWTKELTYQHEGLDAYLRLVAAKVGDGFAVSFADLSEQRRAEQRIRESEQRFRAIVSQSTVGIAETDPAGRFLFVNERYCEITGYSRADLLGMRMRDITHPDDLPIHAEKFRRLAEGGEYFIAEKRFVRPDGSAVWVNNNVSALHAGNGQITSLTSVILDITERHRAEADALLLAELAERIRLADDADSLMEQTLQLVGMHLHTAHCFFTHVDEANNRWSVQHEFHLLPQAHSSIGRYVFSEYPPEVAALLRAGRTLVVNNALTDALFTQYRQAEPYPPSSNAFVVVPLLRESHFVFTAVVTSDAPRHWQPREVALLETVVERVWLAIEKLRADAALRASEERLQRLYLREQAARQQAEEASRLKDEFLATVSHELRTPLTSILGYGQLLQSRQRDPAYIARSLDKIVNSARTQAQLIDDLLDVSRIVTGKLRLEPVAMDMVPVIHAAVDAVRPAIDAKRIRLRLVFDGGESMLLGDPNRLQQVVWNLLFNAAKFTPPEGSIDLELQTLDGMLQIMVRDSGQGISADFLPYVFERFRQAEATSTRSNGGLGLGLSIVRHVVEMHGGTVAASSEGVNRGATFVVSLPALAAAPQRRQPPASPQPSPPECPPELNGMRVLVVEDQPDLLELITELLQQCGAIVQTRTNARDALAELQAWQPDVLLSDIAMPAEDGLWLIRQIQSLAPRFGGNTPAVALTAYARAEDRARVQAAGFAAYLTKPIDPAELRATLARVAQRRA